MTCPICKHGRLAPGLTSVTLERAQLTLVFKSVPARVCDNCGEQFLDDSVSAALIEQAEAAAKAGVQVEVRQYAAA
ncbi:MAG: type II toxin-antitoxin system MqsA family antitoxin [Leptolyngbya sp. PLA3]|nr:MAG: type II toxin-antitoxin system MqsA family antitoxin [Cyanobacteria bacterium CYA]MCE7968990.1 type II toxin-antitoxin system MqsA family antitoxin [Leptolyngbya sp. PL-A3]